MTSPHGALRTTDAAFELRGLTKRYGDRTVVDDLTVTIPKGVVVGFIGPNGAGKTTTMAMLLGLVRPTAGKGMVLGRPLDDPAAFLGEVGALIEAPAFYPALSGRRNLDVFATVGGHDRRQIPALLDLVGLTGREHDRVRTYSMGMKQRLGVAAALLGDPALLILDEPTNGLDPQGIHEMRGLVGSLAHEGRTIFVSSHVLGELQQVCDWLLVIEAGRLRFAGPADELLGDRVDLRAVPEDPRDAARLLEPLRDAGFATTLDAGAVHVEAAQGDLLAVGASVNRLAAEHGIVLAEISPLRTSLEARYLDLVNGGS